ncbi:hypothetical protein GM661_05690 [Iocasia frigidifontis]|uniref:Uncharacterized protein n=1 Tax=Iocasia fonsfrigidae TaxID=2682810 RepID=A0A8A7K8I0_9FIRM|nr:hypothetical protein [Iocasia fonsfrigidae]QTL97510.1 hypothetical protein GM661_05690 [Iocasia fonsfrigidae]
MKAWWKLYKKEIYNISFFMLVSLLITLSWELFLFYKIHSWPLGMPFGLSFLPFSIFPLLVLWLGYNSFRQEWKDDTIYLTLSLPKAGWQINLAKLTASMTFYLAIVILTTLMIYLFQQGFIITILQGSPDPIVISWINSTILKICFVYWISGIGIFIISQFSQLISLFFDRFRGLISIVVFILSNYLLFRLSIFLAPLLKFLPDIQVDVIKELNGSLNCIPIYLDSGLIIAVAIITMGFFFGGSWLLENYLEV